MLFEESEKILKGETQEKTVEKEEKTVEKEACFQSSRRDGIAANNHRALFVGSVSPWMYCYIPSMFRQLRDSTLMVSN